MSKSADSRFEFDFCKIFCVKCMDSLRKYFRGLEICGDVSEGTSELLYDVIFIKCKIHYEKFMMSFLKI